MNQLKKIGRMLYRWWMKFAAGLAFVNTRLLLSVVYIFIIGPLHLVMRLAGKDYLERRLGTSPSYWKKKEAVAHTLESARRQF